MPRTLALVNGRVVVAEIEGKAFGKPLFREADHPRDREGRFIESGALVRILGGSTGTVTGNAGGGNVLVQRADGSTVRVHRGHVTVIERPGGGKPTDDPTKVEALPEQEPAEATLFDLDSLPDVVDFEVPDDAPVPAAPSGRAQRAVDDVMAPDAPTTETEQIPDEEWQQAQPNTEYELAARDLDGAIAKIDAANRRAERAGIAERFGYNVERYEVTITTDADGNRLPIPRIEERARLTLDRPVVRHDGWTFVGTLQWDPEAGLITRLAEGTTLLERPKARECDVCHSQRDRKDTYIVQGPEGQQQQVGSNCMETFLGIKPSNLWMMDWEVPQPDEEGDGGSKEEARYGTIDLLTVTLAIVAEKGWTSKAAAQAYNAAIPEPADGSVRKGEKSPTADYVWDFISGDMDKDERKGGDPAFAARIRDAFDNEDVLNAAISTREYARTIDGDSEYATNLRALANAESISGRNLNLYISAVGAKMRHDGVQAERKRQADATADSQHIGAVGDKIADVKAKVTGRKLIDGQYGTTTLLTFVTEDGNVVKWFASGTHDWDLDDDVVLGGTIKDHDSYNGVAQTVLTRAKVREGGAAGDESLAREQREKAAAKAAAAEQRKRDKVAVPEGFTAWTAATTGEAAVLPRPGSLVRIRQEKPKGTHYTMKVTSDGYGVDVLWQDRDSGRVSIPVEDPPNPEAGAPWRGRGVAHLDDIVAIDESGVDKGYAGYRTWGEIVAEREAERVRREAERAEFERTRPFEARSLVAGNKIEVDGRYGEVTAEPALKFEGLRRDVSWYEVPVRWEDGTEETFRTESRYSTVNKDLR
jgi:hypothetical protein